MPKAARFAWPASLPARPARSVTTLNGRSATGILAVETPSSVTLRRAEKQEDTILRAQIEEIRATAKSLMPDEFEKQINKQELADLIEYLLNVVK